MDMSMGGGDPGLILLVGAGVGAVGAAGLALVAAVFRLTRPRPAALPPPATGFDVDSIRRTLGLQLQGLIGEVTPDVLARFQAVHRRILVMLPRASRLPAGSEDLYILERTATDYLPTTFSSYVSLARAGAADQPVAGGRTPRQALMEQVDLIDQKLEEMAEAINRNDVDRLLAQGRFLEDRFGHGVDVPEPRGDPPPA